LPVAEWADPVLISTPTIDAPAPGRDRNFIPTNELDPLDWRHN
jgi:hypothetical protein